MVRSPHCIAIEIGTTAFKGPCVVIIFALQYAWIEAEVARDIAELAYMQAKLDILNILDNIVQNAFIFEDGAPVSFEHCRSSFQSW